ncbi:FAD/FMN-containing dehydrogenase [Kribbella steppae]|uniref:FAD/FMN-containing dehydrogenase n=1 Tax=Kribbella steppae TaxID=2512223 RepID=A0A4V2RYD7_9ACTN|nr:FAD-binding and (Fe-S)-binding domain-containing protein [Kribbella steppae]TCO19607.1 FAD/FMN-containing dehydrogenase [Kribbella steppae]
MPSIAARLRAAGLRDVRDDNTARAAYSSDASLYRVVPEAVACPSSAAEVALALGAARELGVPVTARGAGTSVAGNAIGPGLVLDLSRHLGRILELDPAAGLARVQPGVVLADLQRAAAVHGLRFGPDPSTHSRCTIGGMVGNDACGSRALGYGRTADNVAALRLVTGAGDDLFTSRGDGSHHTDGFADGIAGLRSVVSDGLATLRTEFGRFGRQVSGYALHNLLPENGFDLTRALVGSEGTLGVLTEITVRLVAEPAERVLVALGFDDIVAAAEATPTVLKYSPTACEGIDARIVEVVRRRRGAAAVPELPRGAAWLLVELPGDSKVEVLDRARDLAMCVDALEARVIDNVRESAALWRIREDGAGLAGRAPSGAPAWSGWEDAAVPPAALGEYLREFEELVSRSGLTHMPFGHFGDGCVHTRLDFALRAEHGADRMREFLVEAAGLVVRHGGSLSGEHGDGRARSELLPIMYSSDALRIMAAVKHVFDPDGVLNPGVLVEPAPLESALRITSSLPLLQQVGFAYAEDGGDFSEAVHRCTGVGKCRVTAGSAGTVMCPSYVATREEKDSTRGRARVLQEMVNGELVDGWRSPAVHDALDLCLSCKGCATDCPTGVDMATWKSEVLHQTYRRRLRPLTHYSLGRLPQWARMASRAPAVANRLSRVPALRRLLFAVAGIDPHRSAPSFPAETFRSWFQNRAGANGGEAAEVLLYVDSFTDLFTPEVGKAMVTVLEAAGYRVGLTPREACCGLTWISTGQLDHAKRSLERTIDSLSRTSGALPIVGIEPSCTAALRHDAVRLVPGDATRQVVGRIVTLAELLAEHPTWTPPDLSDLRVVAQPHCHHHAVMGWDADAALLARAGAHVDRVGGCCGLAGNFGMERGHYDVSVAVAEQQLLPAIARSEQDAVVLADGFSCRTQVNDLAHRPALHLAQLIAQRLARPQ